MDVRHIAKMIKSEYKPRDVDAVGDAQPCERCSAQLRETGTWPEASKGRS